MQIYTVVNFEDENTRKLKSGELVKKFEYSEDEVADFVKQTVLWELVKHVEEDHDHDGYGEMSSSEDKIGVIEPENMLLNGSEVVGCVVDNFALLFDGSGEKINFSPYSYNITRMHSVYESGYYMLRKAEGYGTDWNWDEPTSTITVLRTFNAVPLVYSKCATKLILEEGTDIENVKAIRLLKKITQAEIRCDISKITDNMFYGCELLETIDLPDTIQTVEEYAFSGCKNLKEISLPNVIEIKKCAFQYCSNLKFIEGCEKLTVLGSFSFSNCDNLERFYIGPDLEEFHPSSFGNCDSLQYFVVSDKNKNYCSESGVLYNKEKTNLVIFPRASKICEYILPLSVCTLNEKAFECCSNLKKVLLHEKIKKIPSYCFHYCTSLEFVELPDSISEIEEYAFRNCSSLKELSIPSNVKLGRGIFAECKNIEKIELPYDMISIPDNMFKCCKSLKIIEFPDALVEIGTEAFAECCSLETIDIPISVQHVGKEAFYFCSKLSNVTVRNINCELGARSFMGCGSDLIFKYPVGATFIKSIVFGKNTRFDVIDGKRIDCFNGESYEGNFDDSLTGYGMYRFKKGGYYIGDFVEGRFEGKGLRKYGSDCFEGMEVSKYKSGTWYEGEFKNDKFEGKGKVIYTNGETLVGEFREGKTWNAKGIERCKNGTDLSGEWIDGKFTGSGKEYYSDGSWWKGTWKNGKKDVMDCCYPSEK